jgi:DNA polymerase I-like protein with 3'-5' exonuclease and polymerase domains
VKTMPMFPTITEWVPPEVFPNLSTAKEIAIDLETCDPHMESFGPGWPRNDGFIAGYAVAVDGWNGYFPIAHGGGGNLDKRLVERWITDVLATPADKVMHNAAYDCGWLRANGFAINGRIVDTMLAAPLIDENRFNYSLNSLGFDYLKKVKSEALLKQAAADFGVHPKKELWKLPAMYVGEYAEQDAALTLELWHYFKIKMRQEEVESIFSLETEVFPVLMNMTQRGIRFDRTKAEQLIDRLQKREKAIYQELKSACGSGVDIWAAQSIAVAFDKLGVAYGKTEKGLPSFTKGFLETCEHPVAKLIVEARETNKTHSTFLQPYLDFSAKTGRIHPHVNQMRNEDGGTVTGRLSMANPNLQQVPARHEIIGPLVRSLFLPEEGELWASNDFSSQEPRLLVHYAHLLDLPGANKMVDAYNNDPNTDFHQMVADMAGIKRKAAKTIGLGLMYGMGKGKLGGELDLSAEEASELINTFHTKVPFLKGTVNAVMKRIEHPASGGSIRTLLGRKCRFPLWEPVEWGREQGAAA